jgi:glyoxylase I family protein
MAKVLVRHAMDGAYAVAYAEFVERVRDTEVRAVPGSTLLTEVVARNLYKLMAYKSSPSYRPPGRPWRDTRRRAGSSWCPARSGSTLVGWQHRSATRESTMGMIDTSGLHHLRLTVTNLQRSREFYSKVLGFQVAAESPGSPEDPAVRNDPAQLYGGVVFLTNGMLFGLRPVASSEDRFDSERVGLDHLSFTVASRRDLEQAVQRLDDKGIPHGDVRDLPGFGIAILSFSDPDGIHLELTAAL